jgi:hypothetical protein
LLRLLAELRDFVPLAGLLDCLALCLGAECAGAEALGVLMRALFGCGLRGVAACLGAGLVCMTRDRVVAAPETGAVCRTFELAADRVISLVALCVF